MANVMTKYYKYLWFNFDAVFTNVSMIIYTIIVRFIHVSGHTFIFVEEWTEKWGDA